MYFHVNPIKGDKISNLITRDSETLYYKLSLKARQFWKDRKH